MVSSHSKDISQNGSFPQVGLKKNIWNHHPGVLYVHLYMVLCFMLNSPIPVGIHQFFMQEIHHQVGMVEKKNELSQSFAMVYLPFTPHEKKHHHFQPGGHVETSEALLSTGRIFSPMPRRVSVRASSSSWVILAIFPRISRQKQKKTPWRKVMARIKRGNGWLPTSDNFA